MQGRPISCMLEIIPDLAYRVCIFISCRLCTTFWKNNMHWPCWMQFKNDHTMYQQQLLKEYAVHAVYGFICGVWNLESRPCLTLGGGEVTNLHSARVV